MQEVKRSIDEIKEVWNNGQLFHGFIFKGINKQVKFWRKREKQLHENSSLFCQKCSTCRNLKLYPCIESIRRKYLSSKQIRILVVEDKQEKREIERKLENIIRSRWEVLDI